MKKSVVSSGCLNAVNARKRAAGPEKSCRNNASITEVWKQAITTKIVNLILHYINPKINVFLDVLYQERKPYHARTIEARNC